MPSSAQKALGPQRVDGITVFTRLLAGLGGGIIGFMLIVVALLLFGSLLTNFFKDDVVLGGVQNFAILASLLLTATITNLISCFLLTLTNQSKYEHIGEGLMQVITVNVALFIFSTGAYFLSGDNRSLMYGVIAFHLIFTALASTLVFEVTATRWAYPLVTIYDGLFGTFIGAVFLIVAYRTSSQSGDLSTFLFSIPIIIWGTIGLVSGITEYLYYQSYRRMGVDFLQSKQVAEEISTEDSFNESDDEKPF